jgi:hypothetical protein
MQLELHHPFQAMCALLEFPHLHITDGGIPGGVGLEGDYLEVGHWGGGASRDHQLALNK